MVNIEAVKNKKKNGARIRTTYSTYLLKLLSTPARILGIKLSNISTIFRKAGTKFQ